jgi:hypothetical protein
VHAGAGGCKRAQAGASGCRRLQAGRLARVTDVGQTVWRCVELCTAPIQWMKQWDTREDDHERTLIAFVLARLLSPLRHAVCLPPLPLAAFFQKARGRGEGAELALCGFPFLSLSVSLRFLGEHVVEVWTITES